MELLKFSQNPGLLELLEGYKKKAIQVHKLLQGRCVPNDVFEWLMRAEDLQKEQELMQAPPKQPSHKKHASEGEAELIICGVLHTYARCVIRISQVLRARVP